MIKLATLFSGIGAIEHAFQRMGIEHEVVFACDNGDIDIFSKSVDDTIFAIEKELELLGEYTLELSGLGLENEKINQFKEEQIVIINLISKIKLELSSTYDYKIGEKFNQIFYKIGDMKDLNKTRYTRIQEYYNNILESKPSKESEIFEVMKAYNYIIREYEIANEIEDLRDMERAIGLGKEIVNNLGFEWVAISKELNYLYNFFGELDIKYYINIIKEISSSLSMLHEKIEKSLTVEKIGSILDPMEKKRYIDVLYENQRRTNFVKQSYQANYNVPNDRFHWDISFIDGNYYKEKVDILVGGSPCQSFSLVGKQRGLEDTRGTLFYDYARLISEIKPKVFIYENVKGLKSNDNGQTWETMKQVFDNLGYNWHEQVLNAKDYGIPQNRERIFVVGFRNDLKLKKGFQFPKPSILEKTMEDFLLENVSAKYYLNEKGVKFVTDEKNLRKSYTQIDGSIQLCQKKNQQFNWHGDFVFVEATKDKEKAIDDLSKYFLSEKVRKYVLSSGTKEFYSKPEIDLDIARPLLTTMHKMHRAGVDNYVTTDGRIRKLTPKECLRLMGFCDSFKIVVSDTQMYQQAGNSIVVDVLIAIMDKILESYDFN